MALTKVSTDGVKDDAITSGKIPANAVGASELADNAVDTNAIADQAVALSKLPHGDGSSDGKFLRANNGADPTFETVNTDLVSDTSPQLGGDLQTNGNDIDFADDDKAVFGAGNDMELRHESSSSDSFIMHQNENGHLRILSGVNGNGGIKLMNRINNESYIECNSDAGVELYHNNSKKIETTSNGIKTSGRAEIDGNCFPYSDNNNDLGLAGNRWQDLYLSGNIYLGGTGSANALDDYEEGTWTPANSDMGVTVHYARYTKIGRMVHIVADVDFASSPADSSQVGYLTGLPFTNGNKSVHQHLPWFGTSSANNNQFFNTWFTPLIFANDDKFSFLDSRYGTYLTRATLASKKVRINSTYYTSY